MAALKVAAASGGTLLSAPARAGAVATVAEWDGSHPGLSTAWLQEPLAELAPTDRPGARLTLLAALAPYRITDADVAAWRTAGRNDDDLVRMLSFGAMTAVDRIEAWTTSSSGDAAAARPGG